MSKMAYHFTAKRFLVSIERDGISLGRMLKSLDPVAFLNGYQWLTRNMNFEQSWAKGTGRLPYRRNEVRLTVSIPDEHEHKLRPWSQMKFLTPNVAEMLSAYGDPENWLLYEGTILPEWITEKQELPE